MALNSKSFEKKEKPVIPKGVKKVEVIDRPDIPVVKLQKKELKWTRFVDEHGIYGWRME